MWNQSISTQQKLWELNYNEEYSEVPSRCLGSPQIGQAQTALKSAVKMKLIFKPEPIKLDENVHSEYKYMEIDFLLKQIYKKTRTS